MPVLTASLDEIVFEGRNQAYGAYQLRQEYQSRLTRAGGITLGLCALLLGGWLAWPAPQPKVETTNHIISCPMDIPVPTIVEKPVLPPAQPAATPARSIVTHAAASVPTQVVPDHLVPTLPPDIDQLTTPDGPQGPATAIVPGELPEAGGPGSSPGSLSTETKAAEANLAEPFHYVEKMPEFAGGQAALLRYLREHLRYPTQALREGQEGRVFMSFVVGANGSISEVQVVKGLGYGLDEEALRVVRQMPDWTPGYQAQHPVPVRFTLPVTFKLQ